VLENHSLAGLPAELVDMLVRESALELATQKLKDARNEVLAEKSRLATGKPGLLKSIAGRGGQEREVGMQTVMSQQLHYDSQLKKAESLTTLLSKETGRWLESCLKTGLPDYAAALAPHDYPEDWARFSYNFELLLKSFQMGLQDLAVQFKREMASGAHVQLRNDSVLKLVPVARQIEIDVEFFNRILTQQSRQKKAGAGRPALQPEYSWCETTDQLAQLSASEASATLHELLAACSGFLANLAHIIKREHTLAEERATQIVHARPSFIKVWREAARPAAALLVKEEKLEGIISETQAMLLDGEFSARFNRHMVKTMTPSAAPAAPEKPVVHTAAPTPQSDAELRALKAKLQAELEEAGKIKAGLVAREQRLRENEQALRDNEQRFAEKCKREQTALDEAKARLTAMEEVIVLKARQAEEKQAEEMAKIEELKGELAARSQFIDESEQRLLTKGQEQLESLAELEQKEEELMTTKRELNTLRKEMGLPLIPLRAKPVDEFEE
jgi:hypothetical protein